MAEQTIEAVETKRIVIEVKPSATGDGRWCWEARGSKLRTFGNADNEPAAWMTAVSQATKIAEEEAKPIRCGVGVDGRCACGADRNYLSEDVSAEDGILDASRVVCSATGKHLYTLVREEITDDWEPADD